MRLEHVERRVLGAVRFVDSTTGLQVRNPLTLDAEGVQFRRSLAGYFVVFQAPGLQAHTRAFESPPSTPALSSVELEVVVRDARRHYLPRRFSLRLPRDPDPQHDNQPNWLFSPEDIPLFPAPAAQMAPGWAVVRMSVVDASTEAPLTGALIRITRNSDSAHLASGLSDHRGEAVVAISGIPITTSEEGEGPVLTTEVEATVEAFYDRDGGEIPDPGQLEDNRAALPSADAIVRLASGRSLVLALAITLPSI